MQIKIMPFPDMVPALESGAIEAAILTEPFPTLAEERGVALRPLPRPAGAKATPITAIFWNKDWAAKNPDLAHKVMVAYLKAARDLALDNGWKQERNIDLMVKYTGAKADVIRRARAHVLDANLEMDLAVLESMQRLSLEIGLSQVQGPHAARAPLQLHLSRPGGPRGRTQVAHGLGRRSSMSQTSRPVAQIITPEPVVEGAGVHLRRSLGTRSLDHLDPFLLLDHFESAKPADYQAGFPYHPHRGIETVTLVRHGQIAHGDSLGHRGTIGSGDIQWMSSGSGILHEEMPQVRPEGIAGLQLWLNLPARDKMSRPKYRELSADRLAETEVDTGARIRMVAGESGDGRLVGPVEGLAVAPKFMDVTLPAGATFREPVPLGHTVFAYVDQGEVRFGPGQAAPARRRSSSSARVTWSRPPPVRREAASCWPPRGRCTSRSRAGGRS